MSVNCEVWNEASVVFERCGEASPSFESCGGASPGFEGRKDGGQRYIILRGEERLPWRLRSVAESLTLFTYELALATRSADSTLLWFPRMLSLNLPGFLYRHRRQLILRQREPLTIICTESTQLYLRRKEIWQQGWRQFWRNSSVSEDMMTFGNSTLASPPPPQKVLTHPRKWEKMSTNQIKDMYIT